MQPGTVGHGSRGSERAKRKKEERKEAIERRESSDYFVEMV